MQSRRVRNAQQRLSPGLKKYLKKILVIKCASILHFDESGIGGDDGYLFGVFFGDVDRIGLVNPSESLDFYILRSLEL